MVEEVLERNLPPKLKAEIFSGGHPSGIGMGSNTKPVSPSLLKSKSIFLHEWWLAKPQRHRTGLVVGGVASMERERVFLSTVIAKRHEANVVETEDGITIIFRGFINTSRSSQNGFPSEVCRHFLLGFPHDWKNYLGDEHEYTDGVTGFDDSNASSHKTPHETLQFSTPDNNDFAKRQDILVSNKKKNCNGLGTTDNNMECSIDRMTMEAEGKDNMASPRLSQPQVDMISNGENGVSDVAAVESGQSLMGVPCTGISGKTRVKSPVPTKKLKNDQLSNDRKEKPRTRQKIVEDTGNSCSRVVTRSISKTSHTMLKKDEKVNVTCASPPVRRSPRLRNCRK